MKKLLVMCPNPADATSFWRGVGPFSKLQTPDWQIKLGVTDGSWEDLLQYSAVFLQRPTDRNHVAILSRCKTLSIPTWVDYDDNLFKVPLSNPGFEYYAQEKVKENINMCLELATVVTVSTNELKEQICPRATVIKNAWNTENLPFKARESTKTIVWRGSPTHAEDILSQAEAIVEIYKSHPEYQWKFFGGLNWQLAKMLPDTNRVSICGSTDVMSYLVALEECRPEWLLVPLKDSAFNRAKSDIAWLEATWAGAACIGPHLPEWQSFGCLRYGKPQGLAQVFQELKNQAKYYQRHSEETIIKDGRTLTSANHQRRELLEKL